MRIKERYDCQIGYLLWLNKLKTGALFLLCYNRAKAG